MMQLCARSRFFQSQNAYGYFGMLILRPQRQISSNQLQTFLRPFFFMVHPDLFGQYPEQRATNENSLQILSAHLECLQKGISTNSPTNILFYLRQVENKSNPFKLVKIPMQNTDTLKFVIRILEICGMAKQEIEKIQKVHQSSFSSKTTSQSRSSKHNAFDEGNIMSEEFDLFQFKVRKAREDESIEKFVGRNIDLALIRTKNLDELREDVKKLEHDIKNTLGLTEIVYNCGWNFEHYRGCLKSLQRLQGLYPDAMISLKDKKLYFSQFTGVSLDGEIHLYTGDVQNNWLDLIKNISRQEVYLSTIPMYENTLSQVLSNIKIARRKFMPKTLAKSYSSDLSKVITNILDYLTKNKFPETWPPSLENYELVVESASGPLMVSPTGQIIAPSTCPGFLLVDFITKNFADANIKKQKYKKNKHIERDLLDHALVKLEAHTILKDDNITPDLMISCLEQLLLTELKFTNLNLHITNYYSVLSDGTICIPWNFKKSICSD